MTQIIVNNIDAQSLSSPALQIVQADSDVLRQLCNCYGQLQAA